MRSGDGGLRGQSTVRYRAFSSKRNHDDDDDGDDKEEEEEEKTDMDDSEPEATNALVSECSPVLNKRSKDEKQETDGQEKTKAKEVTGGGPTKDAIVKNMRRTALRRRQFAKRIRELGERIRKVGELGLDIEKKNCHQQKLLDRHFQAREERLENWEREQARIQQRLQEALLAPEQVVHLNVGGKHFSVGHHRLMAVRDSFFAIALSGRWNLDAMKQATAGVPDHLYIDRNPDAFPYVLDYLRVARFEQSGNESGEKETISGAKMSFAEKYPEYASKLSFLDEAGLEALKVESDFYLLPELSEHVRSLIGSKKVLPSSS
jgi:hypothetical protein